MNTPEQVAAQQTAHESDAATYTLDYMREQIAAAIEADRAQRGPEIYIVQDDTGDVLDVFRDPDEATAAYQEGYSVIEETVWEPGEFERMMQNEREDGAKS